MVTNEGGGGEVLEEVVVSLQGPVEFEEVFVVDAGPDRLP